LPEIRKDVKQRDPDTWSPRAIEILDAATGLFFERGYATVSVDEIGRSVGLTGPAIYRHFRSKADILVALFDLTIDRLIEYVGPERDTPALELDALLRGQVRLAVRHTKLVRVFEMEEDALPPASRKEMRRRQKAHVKRWIAALAALRPNLSRAELELLSYAAIGLVLSVPRWPKTVRTHPDLEASLVANVRHMLDAR